MGLSTHILDTSLGRPAPDVAITLYRQVSSPCWTKEGEGRTDSDGRFRGFFADDSTKFQVGVYKLRFEVGQYYKQCQIDTLYPYVEIVFTVSDASQHYHIPLLLSPFGYSTYRGS
ncbi:5-hydroxyisourate hydrolase [Wyeomyia smithii]|uniref:5-hydroxyisourate hydrolase n=1 Tax=Wyeomyia smithii TaxID=174621 RepID=UPI00246806F5|nr:5-hydroxyisourate hydrolase [Wyeomyia smithii]